MFSCRDEGKLSRPVYFDPTHLRIKVKYFANSTYFKISECEDLSIINIIHVNFSCFPYVALFHILSCRGGGKLYRLV